MLTTITEPVEGVCHVQKQTQAFLAERCLGKGALYVTEDNLSWCDDSTGQGFSLEYPSISLHAVSKDTAHFPHECVFCMVEGVFKDEIEGNEDSELEEDDPPAAELRFVPDDKSTLNDIYAAICECQLLHPDEQEQLEDEMAGYPPDYGEEYYTSEDAANASLTEEGQATLERLENVFQIQSQQDFVDMTNRTNGAVNGHEKTENGQFDDMDD
ncbi:methylosome subunit pICln-like [Dendronephthya gigantea]|uniref:methylosome subunit pICln-like n=1 Tax=Dendronephthya gigantea TaxID=151771 RepID=UPI00106CA6DA|nr:methylosome subunit pICln-like [Dendronephthya gigantea]